MHPVIVSEITRLMDSTPITPKPIAVVGISACLPGGPQNAQNLDYQNFFDFLMERGQAYEKIPSERFNVDAVHGPGVGEVITEKGAFLKDLDNFDYIEFGISKKDARLMNISARKLIELTFLALLDSGIDYRGKNVGSYMAGVAHDLWMLSGEEEAEARGSLSYSPSMIANRVSYHLDLRGPSIPIDTACSSSLSALHLAVQGLRNGECEAAVVGGCQVNYRFIDWLAYSQGGILSPDGICKPFDASADGFSRGEGAVVVVLKPLDVALRQHDNVYATILGTGINSSGSMAPANSPVAVAQRDAMQRAFNQAKRKPQEVDFVELHATGTASGDPTEANWVGESFKRGHKTLIGSVKGNIGHLEIAAFLASLCKVCAMFKSGMIPPNVNLRTPNPAIRWKEYLLEVPTIPVPLPCHSPSGRSLIAMSSSGIGGANGHCVVESPPNRRILKSFWLANPFGIPYLFIFGALSPRSVASVAENTKDSISHVDPRFISLTYGRRSRSMPWRSYALYSKGRMQRFSEPFMAHSRNRALVFVFSGQGPQHFNMGRDMFRTCCVFRSSVIEMDGIYRSVCGESLIEKTGLFSEVESPERLDEPWPIAITLPALTIIQIALFDTLVSLGTRPDIVLGHSAGETAVLYASGAACKTMAVELAIARGRSMSILENKGGTMAAISCSAKQVQQLIDDAGVNLDIACFNAPTAVTISGSSNSIEVVVAKAQAAGIFARRLRTNVPVHSSMMDICRSDYERRVQDIFDRYSVQPPSIPVYSTGTGQSFRTPFTAEYFWNSSRGPVLFAEAIQSLLIHQGVASFVEISPHPVLASYLDDLNSGQATIVCPLRRPKAGSDETEISTFLDALGRLVVAGHNCVDFDVLTGSVDGEIGHLPAYPFASRKVLLSIPSVAVMKARQPRNGPLNYPQLRINSITHPQLAQHIIKGEPIMPAAGYLEMALEFGAKHLWNVDFTFMLSLSGDTPTPVCVNLDGPHWTVTSSSNINSQTCPPRFDRLHAEGYMSRQTPKGPVCAIDLDSIRSRCNEIDTSGFYDAFKSFAQYGPAYQRITKFYRGISYDEVLVQVQGLDGSLPGTENYCFHPVVLDAAIHVLVHPLFTGYISLTLCKGTPTTSDIHHGILRYARGQEMELQTKIAGYRPFEPTSFWIVAADGPDGDGAVGFTRALRREYLAWSIHTVVFDSSWSLAEMQQAVLTLSAMSNVEKELKVDASGLVHVSRIALSSPPTRLLPFHPRDSWSLEDSKIVRVSPPFADDDHVRILVHAVGLQDGELWSFFGRSMDTDTLVAGIHAGPLTNAIVSHPLSLLHIPNVLPGDCSGPSTLTLAIAVIALGPGCFENPHLISGEILITHGDHPVGEQLVKLCTKRGFRVSSLPQRATSYDIGSLSHRRFCLILSGYQDSINTNMLSRALSSYGKIFRWNDPETGLSSILNREPWVIGHSIRLALRILGTEDCKGPFTSLEDMITVKTGDLIPSRVGLFNRHKVYILIGGMGSLGLQIAQWMYQNGARHIILTSRSGRNGLLRRGDTMARRLLQYLDGLKDLVIQTETVDAASLEAMTILVDSISKPLGGCMLLSVVLSDGMFSSMTSEKFEEPFPAKITAFEIISNIIDVASLEFFISFSSISGFFGNAGQTNYASANVILDGLAKPYKNAFSIVTPAVTDSFTATGAGESFHAARIKHLTSWGMSSQELLQCIEDGILKLIDGPFWLYIPDFNWLDVRTNMGSSPTYEHLVVDDRPTVASASNPEKSGSLNHIICDLLGVLPEDLSPNVPLTTYGLDSLSAASLSFSLRSHISISQTQLLADMTLRKLEARIEENTLVPSSPLEHRRQSIEAKCLEMEDLLKKYTSHFPAHIGKSIPGANQGRVILVTGTSGTLGAAVLDRLLRYPNVSQIYALNRRDVSARPQLQRHIAAFEARDFDASFLRAQNLTFLEGTVDQMYFGLPADLYHQLTNSVTHIIHAAWPIDFNMPLSSFEQAILGVRQLANFALESPLVNPPRLLFTSSIGVLSGLKSSDATEETPIEDPRISVGAGYIESKWVAERVLSAVAASTALRPVIVRIGQLTGGRNGFWKVTEWVPSMIRSSITLGALPDRSDILNWIPVDIAAPAIIDMMDSSTHILHLVHPHPICWSELMQHIALAMNLPLIPYSRWLSSLEKRSLFQDTSGKIIPALRLLAFFQYSVYRGDGSSTDNFLEPRASCQQAIQVSPTLRDTSITPLGLRDVEKWLSYWNRVGFLPLDASAI
ncbi:putative polyketide synthase [Serpula lacrymans var. lacrymans S7.9]|uniref:Putative polyketide synthase n=1 Tax=Serpula lacrymans var. lacrymans (strain S7.9) TaxID=578457 RepID=F8PDA6_SERL9|nr:putative polyketide synthase [Serpula lacrymans var. lacrymans S7.9]EGO18727.1 putative polyketide synthase [Serpula lacrymans var. lacrymans S7.9]